MLQESVTIISAIFISVSCNRYDIQEQAWKLYKADLPTVISRFRRTPDYLKILDKKKQDVSAAFDEVSSQIFDYYNRKIIPAKVDEVLGLDFNGTLRSAVAAYFQKPTHKTRRNEDDEEMSANELLDHYHLLHGPLSMQQRNVLKNLGFELAGNIIHSVIQSFEPGQRVRSTQQLGGGSAQSTDHVPVHTVTSEPIHKRVSLNMPFEESLSAMKYENRFEDKTRF